MQLLSLLMEMNCGRKRFWLGNRNGRAGRLGVEGNSAIVVGRGEKVMIISGILQVHSFLLIY